MKDGAWPPLHATDQFNPSEDDQMRPPGPVGTDESRYVPLANALAGNSCGLPNPLEFASCQWILKPACAVGVTAATPPGAIMSTNSRTPTPTIEARADGFTESLLWRPALGSRAAKRSVTGNGYGSKSESRPAVVMVTPWCRRMP
jgi:hypothetical protein